LNDLVKRFREENRFEFESVKELYEAGCTDYIFNFVLEDPDTIE